MTRLPRLGPKYEVSHIVGDLLQSRQESHLSKPEQFQDDLRTFRHRQCLGRDKQMKFLPPDGDDVTKDDESGDVGHLEKVT